MKQDGKDTSPSTAAQQSAPAGAADTMTQQDLVNRTPSAAQALGPSAANVFVQVR